MSVRIQMRRDTAAAWTAANPTLAAGEVGWETDTRRQKTGDGATAWNALAYDDKRGTADGVATLDSSGTVPDAQIPATIARDAEVSAAFVAQADRLTESARVKLYRWLLQTERCESITPANVLWIGDSLGEGYNAATVEDRFQSVCRRIGKERRPVAGQRPAAPPNYIPVRYQTSMTPTVGWTVASGNPTAVDVGVGGRGYQLASGDSLTLTVECDYLDLCYQRTGTGSIDVVVDGGAPTTRFTSSNDDLFALNVINDPGNIKSHTVTVSWSLGSPVLCGAFVFQGDSGLGVRAYDACHGGWKSGDFTTTAHLADVSQTARLTWPHLCVIELGVNDYKNGVTSAVFEANVRTLIATVTAAALGAPGTRPGTATGSPTPSFLLLGMYEIPQSVAPSAVEPWGNFLAAMARIAADTADVAFLDLSKQMPDTDPAGLGTLLYIGDQTHLTTRGHRFIGGILADILFPAGGPVDPAGREQNDLYRDGSKSLRTNHRFSAARYKTNNAFGTPTVASGAGNGSSPPAPSISGTDTAGVIGFGTGTSPGTGEQVHVTFATAYTTAPTVIVCKVGSPGGTPFVVASPSTTGFGVGFTSAPSASQAADTYKIAYWVIGQ